MVLYLLSTYKPMFMKGLPKIKSLDFNNNKKSIGLDICCFDFDFRQRKNDKKQINSNACLYVLTFVTRSMTHLLRYYMGTIHAAEIGHFSLSNV